MGVVVLFLLSKRVKHASFFGHLLDVTSKTTHLDRDESQEYSVAESEWSRDSAHYIKMQKLICTSKSRYRYIRAAYYSFLLGTKRPTPTR